jgi:hypothetical protein
MKKNKTLKARVVTTVISGAVGIAVVGTVGVALGLDIGVGVGLIAGAGVIVGLGVIAGCAIQARSKEVEEPEEESPEKRDYVLFCIVEGKDSQSVESAEDLFWATTYLWYGELAKIPEALTKIKDDAANVEKSDHRLVQIDLPKTEWCETMTRKGERTISGLSEFQRLYDLAKSKGSVKLLPPKKDIVSCRAFYRR